jgi:hypothetical protein
VHHQIGLSIHDFTALPQARRYRTRLARSHGLIESKQVRASGQLSIQRQGHISQGFQLRSFALRELRIDFFASCWVGYDDESLDQRLGPLRRW